MRVLVNFLKEHYGVIIIIAATLLGEKVSTGAPWWIIIQDNFWGIILVFFIYMIVGIIIKYYKDNH